MYTVYSWGLFRVDLAMLRQCYLDTKKLTDAKVDEDSLAIL